MNHLVTRTINLARENVKAGGRPFACIIVKGEQILAQETSQVLQTQDPTAHAEMLAIQKACALLNSEHLTGCDCYVLSYPCPMCLAAFYYATPDKLIFISSQEEYTQYYVEQQKYFSLHNFYQEMATPWEKRAMPMVHHPDPRAIEVYQLWKARNHSNKKPDWP